MSSSASSAASASWFARTAVIRAKVYDGTFNHAPEGFQTAVPKWREFSELKYTLQVAPEDCTGCGLCVAICPAKSKSEAKHRAINMAPQPPLREKYNEYWNYFLSIPELSREKISHGQVKDAQLLEPLFEFSGACAGCGETPYISTMTRLFGDRALIANATGCSSIYGGNLPTTPYTVNKDGRGPAWSNSLFEDNAEFGMGMRLAVDKQNQYAKELVEQLAGRIGDDLAVAILSADQSTEEGIFAQRERVKALKDKLAANTTSPRRATCWQLPTLWSRRASGSSAAMAGATTSVTAASITCWLPMPTSTSCSSTPRSTPTPAARCRSPRRSAQSPSSPPAASTRPRKTSR